MTITKSHLKLLNYVYFKKSVSYKSLQKKFRNHSNLKETLELLVHHHYLNQAGGSQTNLGSPIPIINETIFTMDDLGSHEVESKQWFNMQFVLTSLILPIIVGVASSAITAILLVLLG